MCHYNLHLCIHLLVWWHWWCTLGSLFAHSYCQLCPWQPICMKKKQIRVTRIIFFLWGWVHTLSHCPSTHFPPRAHWRLLWCRESSPEQSPVLRAVRTDSLQVAPLPVRMFRYPYLAFMIEVVPDEESSHCHPKLLVCPFHTAVPAVPDREIMILRQSTPRGIKSRIMNQKVGHKTFLSGSRQNSGMYVCM